MLARSLLLARSDAVILASRAASPAAAPSKPTGRRVKTFEIYRYDPEKSGSKPYMK
ncbi:hypothetical protein ANCDUO_26746, partial [Ancylostoma duodenale]